MKNYKKTLLSATGYLSILAITISSCTKTIHWAIEPPEIFSTTGVASPGNTIIVNGNGFVNPITATVEGIAVVVTYVNSTAVTIVIPSSLPAGTYDLRLTSNGVGSNIYDLTIGVGCGCVSSDTIAVANLIAHWSFDNSDVEMISGLFPITTGTTSYVPGQIGNAISFDSAYLIYPPIPNIDLDTALAGGFTLTMWVKLPVMPNLTSLWQINGNIGDIFGLAALAVRVNANDTMDFDGTLTNVDISGTHSTTFSAYEQGYGKGLYISNTAWEFLTMSFDTSTNELNYYGNGILTSSTVSLANILYPSPGQFTLVTPASNPGYTINQVSFGTFDVNAAFGPNAGTPGATWQNASLPSGTYIDDTRLYNKALNLAQIDSLYSLGVAGK